MIILCCALLPEERSRPLVHTLRLEYQKYLPPLIETVCAAAIFSPQEYVARIYHPASFLRAHNHVEFTEPATAFLRLLLLMTRKRPDIAHVVKQTRISNFIAFVRSGDILVGSPNPQDLQTCDEMEAILSEAI